MADVDTKQIVYQLVVDSQNLVAGLRQVIGAQNEEHAALAESAEDSAKYRRELQNMSAELKAMEQSLKTTAAGNKAMGDAQKENAGASEILSNALKNLAASLIAMFGLQQIISFLKEAAQYTIELSQANFKLDASVRSMQETGLQTTLKDWHDEVSRLREEFRIFAEKDLTNAMGQIALSTRTLGLNQEQMFNVTKMAAELSAVSGQDLPTAVNALTRALETGQTRGLQPFGLSLKQVELDAEAMKLGIAGTSAEWSEGERALIIYNALMEKNASLSEDAAKAQDTLAGKARAATAAIVDAETRVGASAGPIMVFLNEQWAAFLNRLADAIDTIKYFVSVWVLLFSGATGMIFGMIMATTEALNGNIKTLDQWVAKVEDTILKADKVTWDKLGMAKWFQNPADSGLGDKAIGSEESNSKAKSDLSDFEEEMNKIAEDAARKRLDAEQKHKQRLLDIERDYERSMQDLVLNFNRNMERMNEEYTQNVRQVQEKLAEDIKNINASAAQDIKNAELKSQMDSEKAEEDHLNRLLELRERYLMSLDEAVRQRDARAVLQLNEKYALDINQENRNHDLQERERQQQLEFDKYEIEMRRRQKIAEAIEQERFRLQQMAEELAFQKKLAMEKFNQEKADEERLKEQKIHDEQERLRLELQDIQTAETNKVRTLIESWAQQRKITEENAKAVYDIVRRYTVDGVGELYHYMIAAVGKMQQAMAQAASHMVGGPKKKSGSEYAGAYAEGGMVLATQPTTATFGEAGPELAQFTPLDRAGADVNKLFGSMAGAGNGNAEKATIQIRLSDGLIGEIVDNTMGAMATVVLTSGG